MLTDMAHVTLGRLPTLQGALGLMPGWTLSNLLFNHHVLGVWLVLGIFIVWRVTRAVRSRRRPTPGERPRKPAPPATGDEETGTGPGSKGTD